MVSEIGRSRETWRQQTTKVALTRHFEERIAGSRASGRDGESAIQFERNLKAEIIRINHAIRADKYRFAAYQLVLKSKGRQKFPREISLPRVRDRIVLRALASTLNLVAPACSIELAQTKISRVVSALSTGRYSHYLKLDVMDFYPSIDHEWLRATLQRTLAQRALVDTFMNAVESPTLSRSQRHLLQKETRGVPQGLAISNGLAELSVQHVDDILQKDDRIAYFRYVDDVLVLMEGDLSASILPVIKRSLALAGLTPHPVGISSSKSAVGAVSEGFEFLGYRFSWPRVTVRKGSIDRLEASLARTFTRYRYAIDGPARAPDWSVRCVEKLQWHLDLIVSGCVFEGNRLGWLAYFSQIRHQQLLEHLDAMVRKQMTRRNVTGFTPKRFVDSYRFAASRRTDESGFVPNFDETTIGEMRRILIWIFFYEPSHVGRLSDEDVRERFNRKIRGVVVELERDIQSGY